jgi:hypothetical protein
MIFADMYCLMNGITDTYCLMNGITETGGAPKY